MATEIRTADQEKAIHDLLADFGRIPLTPGPPPDESGGWRPPSEPEQRPLMENAQLATLIFLGAEAMFFAALIAAYLVARVGAIAWPPPFQPRLPVEVTAVNTLFLLASSLAMVRARRAIRRGDRAGLVRGLGQTALLGTTFLFIQGYEWIRLVSFGLTASSGMYGATFYTLIGIHGAHVLAAVIWLSVIFIGATRERYSQGSHLGVTICGIYWHFVVAVWPILFTLVYLV